jgi:hypothetical protein
MIRLARFHILSDLNLDPTRSSSILTPQTDIDAVIVTGGAFVGPALLPDLRSLFAAALPLVAVLGNREFWGGLYDERLGELRACADDHDITVLQNEAIVIAVVSILGTTLWTDHALHGDKLRCAAMEAARTAVLDHRRIAWTGEPGRLFGPEEAAILHAEAGRFLNGALGAIRRSDRRGHASCSAFSLLRLALHLCAARYRRCFGSVRSDRGRPAQTLGPQGCASLGRSAYRRNAHPGQSARTGRRDPRLRSRSRGRGRCNRPAV